MDNHTPKSNPDSQSISRDTTHSFIQKNAADFNKTQIPKLSLPTGGGAIRGIEEKFQVNAVTGTSSFSIPIPLSPTRHGFMPAVGLTYNSGSGNSPFGLGWGIGIPVIARKTEKQLPQYRDEKESDTFILSGAEDLVPLLERQGDKWIRYSKQKTDNGKIYTVTRYRPRIEGSFTRIEKWKNNTNGDTHWKTISGANIHSYYGMTPESRISDPHDETKIFEWLLCRTHDDKGNVTLYQYKKEDFVNIPFCVSEKNKVGNCTQTYIKKILYGNKRPYYLDDAIPTENDFMFQVIFDYGEHDTTALIPKDIDRGKNNWKCRKDIFSSYRSGFEIRTYRRCNRVMVFHCFEAFELPHTPYLVKSLELNYDDEIYLKGNTNTIEGFSFLVKARQNGHKWDDTSNHYLTKHLPDLEISYQSHEWNTKVKKVTPGNAFHAPMGINSPQYLWLDLFSEGISGILTEQATGWFYKTNLGNGLFSHAKPVAPKPAFSGLASGLLSVQELEGNGIKCLVQYENEPKGFFKLTSDAKWEPFRNFEAFPNIDTLNPNMRSIDLSGDGLADLLITEENVLRWYPGAGEKGFEVSRTVSKAIDEEKGPAILFEDGSQSIFLADMSGDGLTDILRIRNGEVCYWPNLGYGHFGAKVNMDNAPLFDHPDTFNPAYLRLADIDGSGTIDIVYLGKNNFRVWMNLNGNAWTLKPQIIESFPHLNNLTDVSVLDFLGSGTACIVHSSSLPQDTQQPLQYIDLMGSKKPNLLIAYQNNCGKEASIEYKSSTHFYLEDKKEGREWITKLPFPVHCLFKTKVEDKIRDTVFTSSYRYSHGYYDHHEREFRGFARVEQFDTEEFSQFKINTAKNVVEEELHQPPVKTISWFHTGAYLHHKKILHQCEKEYFNNNFFTEYDVPEPVFEEDLSPQELREAYRACKGIPLRIEIYAEDGTDKSALPYSATQSTVEIHRVQPLEQNKYASFLITPSESVSYGYERNPSDPRIGHSYVLETDELGNVTKSASVVYPRVNRPVSPDNIPDKVWDEQKKLHVTYGEAFFTNDISQDSVYRLRSGFESKSYEISGVNQPPNFFISKQSLADAIAAAVEILFEEEFTTGAEKRLIGHRRAYFLKDNLSGPMPLGQLSELAIGHKSYQLAFTKNLVNKYYGPKVTDAMLSAAGYEHSEGDQHWWVHSGTAIYRPDPKNNFYTPIGGRDVFGNESFVEYDSYSLLVKQATDAIENTSSSVNDYRTLSPILLTDPNLNRAAVETDELGLVVRYAVMGKEGAGEGDTLADPTARIEYDLFNWQNNQKPNFVHTFVREQHGPSNPRWQESYAYSDGGGSLIMTKTQAEPGKARKWNTSTKQIEEIDADPRWVGNGRTVINNKGNPVKQYEPYFSSTHEYENEDALVETGVTPIVYYDPVGRNIRTEAPNGTFSKIEFDAWYFNSFDVNDTVKDSQWYSDRGSPAPDLVPEPIDPEQRAAWLAAKHYNTPGTSHTDSLGRTCYAVTDYGSNRTSSIYSETDLVGRYTRIYDQLGRKVSEGYTNLIGATIYGKSAEKGEQWVFTDVMGRIVKIWDNNIRELRSTFDKLHRPVSTFVKEGGNEILFGHVVYGDLFPDAEAVQRNLKGKTYQLYDQAGAVTLKDVDFKGNVTAVERRLTREYKELINWQLLEGLSTVSSIETAAESFLEDEVFTSSSVLDAINRPTLVTLPDNSIVEPTYNEANSLDSLRVKIRGQGNFITFLESQEYDVKGQRQFAKYGNGLITHYFYDPKTFHLINLVTKKEGASDTQSLQNLHYTFDPVGNIVYSKDEAQQTHYFKNAVVKPESKFEYDAIYQLVKATGREHAGLVGNAQRNHSDLPFLTQLPHSNDTNAVRQYAERYEYDDCGNIQHVKHIAKDSNWTRKYRYEYQDDVNNNTNRLKSTSLPGDAETGPYSANYQHDTHGNMTQMPHLNEMVWNFMDQLTQVNLGGGGMAFFIFGLLGVRTRKIIERLDGKKTERIYLGAVEIYREYQNNTKKLERSTLHISDNTGRIAQVDTKLFDADNRDPANPLNTNLIRYQYSNHLGSATLETDEAGSVISYEEYHPYGTSAYRNSKSGVNFSLKRYRFSGKERDDETGLYYFGARFYAAWLGRWTSSDPAGFVDGLNLFRYCRNNPVNFQDPNGLGPWRTDTRTWRSLGTERDPVTNTEIDTAPEFARWAQRHNISYEGTPRLEGRTWHVERWRTTDPGQGGPVTSPPPEPTPPASPPPEPTPPASPPPEEPPETPPGGTGQAVGGAIARHGPRGSTIEVPDTVDDPKLRRLNEHARQGNMGRNTGPANPTTARRNSSLQRNALAEFKSRIQRPTPSHAAGHRVDMQYDLSGRIGNHWRDYIWEDGATNTNDGFEGYRKLRSHPQGEPAGGAARTSEMGRFRNSPRFRTGLRLGGGGLTALGVGFSGYGLYNDIVTGDIPMGIGDSFGVVGGGIELYGIFGTGAAAGVALPLGIALGGVAVAATSGVSGYRAAQRGDTAGTIAGGVGVAAGTSLAVGGGIALASAAGVAMAPALVAAAPVLIVAGAVAALGVGIFHAGRYFDWW